MTDGIARLSLIAAASFGLVIPSFGDAPTLAYLLAHRGSPTSGTIEFGIASLTTGTFISKGNTELLHGLGEIHGTIYSVDNFDNLVTINPGNATVTLVGPTGIHSPVPAPPGTPYHSVDVFASLATGQLFALDWGNNLYSIDPSTGAAKLVGSTGIPTLVPAGAGIFAFTTGLAGTVRQWQCSFPAPLPAIAAR
jgi:hypothetical protein